MPSCLNYHATTMLFSIYLCYRDEQLTFRSGTEYCYCQAARTGSPQASSHNTRRSHSQDNISRKPVQEVPYSETCRVRSDRLHLSEGPEPAATSPLPTLLVINASFPTYREKPRSDFDPNLEQFLGGDERSTKKYRKTLDPEPAKQHLTKTKGISMRTPKTSHQKPHAILSIAASPLPQRHHLG